MFIYKSFNEFKKSTPPRTITIGMFDGVHLGHQAILTETVKFAEKTGSLPTAITFSNHPESFFAPDAPPELIYPTDYKIDLLEAYGIHQILLLDFNAEIAALRPEEFVAQITTPPTTTKAIFVGPDFRFGRNRTGDISTLRELGHKFGFMACTVSPATFQGIIISSTKIRETIKIGNFELASTMLGRPYAIVGKVVPEKQLASSLGFPTANLDTNGLVLPPRGVYFVKVKTPAGEKFGVANVGLRPTLHSNQQNLTVEVHILDYAGKLYDLRIEVIPLELLRPEIRFESVSALKKQIEADIQTARKLIQKYRD